MTSNPVVEAILPDGSKLDLKGPDFTKLKCEQPLADTAVVLEQARDDADAVTRIKRVRILTLGLP